jgi:hypothetical protein
MNSTRTPDQAGGVGAMKFLNAGPDPVPRAELVEAMLDFDVDASPR